MYSDLPLSVMLYNSFPEWTESVLSTLYNETRFFEQSAVIILGAYRSMVAASSVRGLHC